MIRRSTWVILIIFVLLAGLAWYLRENPLQTEPESTPLPDYGVLLEVNADEIQALEILDAQGQSVLLQRDGSGEWSLAVPQAEAADSARVDPAVSQLVSIRLLSEVSTAPPMSEIGLDPADYTITLTLADGQQKTVRIGDLTPIQSGYYVLGEDQNVYVASQFAVDGVLDLFANPPVLLTPTAEPSPAAGEP